MDSPFVNKEGVGLIATSDGLEALLPKSAPAVKLHWSLQSGSASSIVDGALGINGDRAGALITSAAIAARARIPPMMRVVVVIPSWRCRLSESNAN